MSWWGKRKPGSKPGDCPVNVLIVNKMTGVSRVCKPVYCGVDHEEMHIWQITSPFDPETEKITIGVLPPKTSVVFAAHLEKGERGDGG